MTSVIEVFLVFLRLGLTSFGGPIAHLAYFHDEFVKRRLWLDEQSYADLVSLCQILPGPSSSQVGLGLGLFKAGPWGAFAAWLGFTLPSAILMTAFGIGISSSQFFSVEEWLHDLKLVAVPVVAQALWLMAPKLCNDWKKISIALICAITTFLFSSIESQALSICFGGLIGFFIIKESASSNVNLLKKSFSRKTGAIILLSFVSLLCLLPLLSKTFENQTLKLFDGFFRAGSLVFGGGHVVLPLLKTVAVDSGWLSAADFLTGYGAAQAVPGPLFSFAAYVGASSSQSPAGILGAVICLFAIFLPSFFLLFGVLPFWESLRNSQGTQSIVKGASAAVVGILITAFINPVILSSIHSTKDIVISLVGILLLLRFKWPSWGVVLVTLFSYKMLY